MRLAGVVVVAVLAALTAGPVVIGLISEHPAHAEPAKKKAVLKKNTAAAQPAPGAYSTMPLGERVSIQFDLAWSGDYNGLVNGEFTDKSVAAVKAFQKRNGFKETGVLAAPERALLAASSKTKQEQVGWMMVEDAVTGAQVGLPGKQAPNASRGKSGTRWSSAQGQVQIETFRIREPGATLETVFEQQKKEPVSRRLEANLLRPDFFILSGMQGLKKFYVRAERRNDEVRGLTILYDQATEGIMDPIVVAMSAAFAPFPGSGIEQYLGQARRRVEYGTGIVVTSAGYILTDWQLTDGCRVIEVSGYGNAERAAEDKEAGLTLLRLYGASGLAPAALVHEGAKGGDLTLVGIADPQAQSGDKAASTATARLDRDFIQPSPPLGFAGAAALDTQGRFFGMVALKSTVVAGTGPAPLPQVAIVPVGTLRKFLEVRYVTPATGAPGIEAAKKSIVRVICVRR